MGRPAELPVQRDWWDDATDAAGGAWGAAKEAASGAWDAAAGAAEGFVSGVSQMVGNAWSSVTGKGSSGASAHGGAGGPSLGGGSHGGPGPSWGGLLSGGSVGPVVRVVQDQLGGAGFLVPMSGIFDGPTMAAVKAFQKAAGLVADGVVGPKTMGALKNRGDAGPTPNGGTGGNGATGVDSGLPPFVLTLLPRETGGQAVEAVVMNVLRCLASFVGWETLAYAVPELWKRWGEWSANQKIEYIMKAVLIGGIFRQDVMCHCPPRDWLIRHARSKVEEAGPRALQHLDHYLEGSGTPITEDLAALFQEDAEFRRTVENSINDGAGEHLIGGRGGGTGALSDDLYLPNVGLYSVRNWEFALGGLDHLRYKLLRRQADGKVVVEFDLRDPYQWHPAEHDRGAGETRCAHVVLEFAKESGAREFEELGHAQIPLRLSKKLADKVPSAD